MGTSAWLGVVTSRRLKGKRGVATIHSADPDKLFLVAESETAGGCLEWAARHLYSGGASAPDVYAAMDQVVDKVTAGSHGLIFTPWMYGERAPIADCNARSSFLNLSGQHTRQDMMRAVYEGVAYNIRWLVEIVSGEFGFPLPKLRAIGGGARSATWMQMLADVTHRRIETVPDPKEAGAIGAALVAAVGLGIYPSFEALESVTRVEKTFEPRQENFKTYDPLFDSFRESYGRLRVFLQETEREDVRYPRFERGGVEMNTEEILGLPSALPDGVDYDQYLIATYLANLSAAMPAPLLSMALAVEQSTGTWVPVPGETPELRREHIAKVIGVYGVPDYEFEVPKGLETRDYIIQVAYPEVNIGEQIPMLMTTVIGNVSMAGQRQAAGRPVPQEIRGRFQGPQVRHRRHPEAPQYPQAPPAEQHGQALHRLPAGSRRRALPAGGARRLRHHQG